MQVASGRGPGRTHPGYDLANPNGVALLDCDSLKMVVGGDEPVAVVYLHTISATPRVPAHGAHNPGVGRIDPRSTCCGIVLTPVEFT